nr:SpoIIE family protein phosphatase [Bacteroidota bacterium]
MSSTLEILRSIDPAKEPEKFYHLLCRNMLLMSSEDNLAALELAAAAKDASDLNAASHAFIEGMHSLYSSDFSKVLSHLFLAEEIFLRMNHKGGQMAVATILCTCYRSLGQLDKAQDSIQKGLKCAPEVSQDETFGYFKSVTYYQAGEINSELRNYESALEFLDEGLKYAEENKELKGRLLNGIGVVFMNLGKWDESLSYLGRSLKTISSQNNMALESKILADIGMFYFKKKEYDLSLTYLEKSLKIRLEKKMVSPAITNYIRLAELCLASGNSAEALRYGHLAVEESERLKVNIKLYEAHQILSNIYESLGDIEKAYEHYKKYNLYKDEVHSQEVIRKVENLKGQYKVESAQQEKEIFRLRNVELKAAMNEITESFRYAKRIQTAILPPDGLIKQLLPDSFVLFMPKDIVSGDFYWMEVLDDKILLAAVDCTGHGVPGAMVSMVGHNCLNKAVHEFGLRGPAAILNKLTELVEGTFVHKDFQYDTIDGEIKDGMDISICSINLKEKRIEWAGANNPLWICSKGEMKEITADKQPVGKYDHRHPFTNHKLDIETGDIFYLFTDGYADQFGGPAGKKFKYKQLKELLLSLSDEKMSEQKDVLES